ncbi:putative nuclear protein NAP [Blattamonas nauphoetae]|uniref:Nuclear protein NAP n=1 Tax=Blattamonas nauphoetae TaxID=2049346 RepID=A0ABQ9X8L4_9EUKA|nr:putative nuclear protein NAP [Blattamonas nauphoetae]
MKESILIHRLNRVLEGVALADGNPSVETTHHIFEMDIKPFQRRFPGDDPLIPTEEDEEEKRLQDILKNLSSMPEAETLDSKTAQILLLNLEKNITTNHDLRSKYPNNPQNFMESEFALDESIAKLKDFTTNPSLLPLLISTGSFGSLVGLLEHQNVDIVLDVIDVLRDFTDEDLIAEEPEALVLVDQLVEDHVEQILVSCLWRFNESLSEEQIGIFNVLSLLDSILSHRPQTFSDSLSDTTLTQHHFLLWLVKRIKLGLRGDARKKGSLLKKSTSTDTSSSFYSTVNYHYASEFLSILVSSSKQTQEWMLQPQAENDNEDGLLTLLQALAAFRKTISQKGKLNNEEKETVENIVNTTCSCLFTHSARQSFYANDGIDLALRLCKFIPSLLNTFIKLCSFATTFHPSNCISFVENDGLGVVFGVFMTQSAFESTKGQKAVSVASDEHVITLITNLTRHLTGVSKERLLAKFQENNFEKIDRLFNYHLQYLQRVSLARQSVLERAGLEEGDDISENDKDAIFQAQLEAGQLVVKETAILFGLLATDRSSAGSAVADAACQSIFIDMNSLGEKSEGDENQEVLLVEEIIDTIEEYLAGVENDGDPERMKELAQATDEAQRIVQDLKSMRISE